MRIIAGTAKGRKLAVSPGAGVRPLMDRIKESIFSQLGDGLEGKKVLDLFAGTGAFGLEAISRGAGKVWFVDASRELMKALQANIQRLHFDGRTEVICGRAEDFVQATGEVFDCIFVDPPFKDFAMVIHPVIHAIVERKVLGPQGLLLVRCFHKDVFETAQLRTVREKKYGENKVLFYQWPDAGKEAA